MVKAVVKGVLAGLALLLVYFGVVSALSGPDFAFQQFAQFWYFILALAAGFGIQVGLYSILRAKVRAGGMLAVSGTTSAAAMLSCCAHYLANLLPFLGAAGAVALVAQYQIELFWGGLLFNLFGIAFLGYRLNKLNKLNP